MISMNFQQLKKKKFRGFSTHFSATKNGKGTDMILLNFSKNAVIFKASYMYQNTNVCSEIPFSKNLYSSRSKSTDYLQYKSMDWFLNETKFY